ncbi:MAG TPA: addiction module protein [Caulobacteraceae bacterium]|jgi:putative addiction module component (TIGR02574 family)
MRTVDIDKLTPAEKLELIGELWDSLEADDVPLTQAQIDEIDRRLATADEDVAQGKTLEEILEGLRLDKK